MIDRITVGAASLVGAPAAATGLARWAVTPPTPSGRHRVQPRTVPLEELLGPPNPYTTPSFTDVPSRGVITQGFGFCVPCGKDTAGVLASDGWWCGECLASAPGEAS